MIPLMKENPARRTLEDTMIPARNYRKLIGFYRRFVGLKLETGHSNFTLLRDPKSRQALCIPNGRPVGRTSPGISVPDLEAALKDIRKLGGKVTKRWEFGSLRGANAKDPEGNEILVWQVEGGRS